VSDENDKKEAPVAEGAPDAEVKTAAPEAQPDAKAEAKPDAEVEAKPDAKAEAKPDAKVEAKPDDKSDDKAEAKADAKSEAKPGAEAAGEKPAATAEATAPATPAPAAAAAAPARGGPRGGGDRGGRGGPPGRRDGRRGDRESSDGLYEKVIKINRTAKVVKGGRRFSFSVLGVVGDQKGRVGFGMGKANGVPAAIKKAFDKARQNMVSVPLSRGRTIAYPVEARFAGAQLIMRPATPGTGIIAGGACRAVMEAVGVQDILTKKIGSSNPGNVLRATFKCFAQLKSPHEIAKLRGVTMHQLFRGHDAPEPSVAAGSEG
jgi:small subunit ribosomal protein S5